MKLDLMVKVTEKNVEQIMASRQAFECVSDCIEKLNELINAIPEELEIKLIVNEGN